MKTLLHIRRHCGCLVITNLLGHKLATTDGNTIRYYEPVTIAESDRINTIASDFIFLYENAIEEEVSNG